MQHVSENETVCQPLKLLFRKVLSLLLLFFVVPTLKAEWKLATVNDADGFTNIRSGKGVSFTSVTTIKANEFFYCEPAASDWWEVNTMYGEKGFMHKNRIKLVDQLPDTSKRSLLFTTFRMQKALADKFRQAWRRNDSLAYRQAVRKLEEHSENAYSPLLEPFVAYFCKTRDTLLLQQLFSTMWANSGSANERPSFVAGDVFACQTEVVASTLKKLPKNQKQFIAEAIEWGLLNHFDGAEEEKLKNADFTRLKRRLALALK